MTGNEVTAVITAVTALVTAVTALVRQLRHQRAYPIPKRGRTAPKA